MGPIDYSINVRTPFESAMQGLKGGLAVQGVIDANAERVKQQQAARAMQADLGAFAQKTDRTAADYASIVAKYPQLSEHFKRGWEMEAPDVKAARVSEMSNVFAAVNNGAPEVAIDVLTRKAEAARNSGDARTAASAEAMARLIKMNPEAAKTAVGLGLYAATGDEKFAETLAKLTGVKRTEALLPGEVAQQGATTQEVQARTAQTQATTNKILAELPFIGPKAQADLRNTLSQISERTARLRLDQDKFVTDTQLRLRELNQKAGELPDGAAKLVNDAAVGAVAASQSAGQMLDLASRLETQGGGFGAFGSAAEWLAKTTGSQDAMSALRQEYTRLRNSAAVKSLPPGPATDKDIELALKGFPPENADARYIASFLRGQAKLQQLDAVTNDAKAEWVAQVKSLRNAPGDVTVLGVRVPAGTSFADFSRQVVERKAREQSAMATIQSSPYAQFANSPAPTGGLSSPEAPEPQ